MPPAGVDPRPLPNQPLQQRRAVAEVVLVERIGVLPRVVLGRAHTLSHALPQPPRLPVPISRGKPLFARNHQFAFRRFSRRRPTSSSRVLVAVGSIVAARAVWRAASAAATASLLLGLGGGPAVSTPGHGTALWSGQRSERAMRASPGETVGSHNHERTVGVPTGGRQLSTGLPVQHTQTLRGMRVPWTEGWVHVEAAPTGSDTRACGRVHAPAAGRNAVASAPRESTLRQRGGRGAASQQADPARSHGQSAARPRARGAPPRQQAPPSPGRHTR